MSAVAEPANETNEAPRSQAVNSPMRQLPLIHSSASTAQSQEKRQTFNLPIILPGEFVFYRPNKHPTEHVAWVTQTHNRTVTLIYMKPGSGPTEIKSVCYYDHTEADPWKTADPMAAYNNAGTFRRTAFGAMFATYIESLKTKPLAAANEATLKELKNRVESLERVVAKMESDSMPEPPKARPAAETQLEPPGKKNK